MTTYIATTEPAPSMNQQKIEFVGDTDAAKVEARRSCDETKRTTAVYRGTYCVFMIHGDGRVSIDRE